MICPVCEQEDCFYFKLARTQTWHPPLADLNTGLPDDYLKPIWRLKPEPGNMQIFAMALDPREACFVLCNGATFDGKKYQASFDGWDGRVEDDGRIGLRFTLIED